jgi:hypothetical protein
MTKAKTLEVHEHHFISGPRSCTVRSQFSHSHEGGDRPHVHPDTGPAAYTIDADDWFASTGLRGGGKKKFTAKPTGEQFECIPRTPEPFRVIFLDPPHPAGSSGDAVGPGQALPLRIAKTFRAPFTVETLPRSKRAKCL